MLLILVSIIAFIVAKLDDEETCYTSLTVETTQGTFQSENKLNVTLKLDIMLGLIVIGCAFTCLRRLLIYV